MRVMDIVLSWRFIDVVKSLSHSALFVEAIDLRELILSIGKVSVSSTFISRSCAIIGLSVFASIILNFLIN